MPDILVKRFWERPGDAFQIYDQFLCRSFKREGKLWTECRGSLVLLRDDGTAITSDGSRYEWETL